MAKRSTTKSADKPAEAAATPEPVAAEPAAPEEADQVEATEEEAPVFQNRAARRARGKGASQPQPHGQQSQFARRGNVGSRRDYGHRRSG